jgi:hypothetical protein
MGPCPRLPGARSGTLVLVLRWSASLALVLGSGVRGALVILSGARGGSIALLVSSQLLHVSDLALISDSAFVSDLDIVSGLDIISVGAFFVSGLGLDLRLPPDGNTRCQSLVIPLVI